MATRHAELTGVNDVNKGAELMLHAVAEQQAGHLQGWTVAVSPDAASFEARGRAGVRQRVRFDRLGPLGPAAGNVIPRRVRQPLGLVAQSEIEAVLDASGFAYSEQQRLEPFAARVRQYRRMHRKGRRVILLPQAFGPFTSRQARTLGTQLLEHTDLAFARDAASHQALTELHTSARIQQAPDFTNLVRVEATGAQRERYGGRACLVPNFRMVDRTDPDAAEAYRTALRAAVHDLQEQALRPFVLIVNAKKDDRLAGWLQGSLGREIEVAQPTDPLDVKRILGTCRLVVASRFHALASAMGQGVPTVALGWSHKYPALMRDHGVGDLLADVHDLDGFRGALAGLAEPDEHARVHATLQCHAAELEGRTEAMWQQVAACLRG